MRKKRTLPEILAIISGHEDKLTSAKEWNLYSKENGLPHSQTLISYFGSWNKLKECLSLDLNDANRSLKYTDEMLNSILDSHKEHYTSATEWDKYAEINNLPKHFIFMNRFGADKIREKTNFVSNWTTEQIVELITMHFPTKPPTQVQWNELCKQKRVPSYQTIIRRFGTWNKMKHEVYYK